MVSLCVLLIFNAVVIAIIVCHRVGFQIRTGHSRPNLCTCVRRANRDTVFRGMARNALLSFAILPCQNQSMFDIIFTWSSITQHLLSSHHVHRDKQQADNLRIWRAVMWIVFADPTGSTTRDCGSPSEWNDCESTKDWLAEQQINELAEMNPLQRRQPINLFQPQHTNTTTTSRHHQHSINRHGTDNAASSPRRTQNKWPSMTIYRSVYYVVLNGKSSDCWLMDWRDQQTMSAALWLNIIWWK